MDCQKPVGCGEDEKYWEKLPPSSSSVNLSGNGGIQSSASSDPITQGSPLPSGSDSETSSISRSSSRASLLKALGLSQTEEIIVPSRPLGLPGLTIEEDGDSPCINEPTHVLSPPMVISDRLIGTLNDCGGTPTGREAVQAMQAYLHSQGYELGEGIGRGWSSRVFKARDLFGRSLAIKIMRLKSLDGDSASTYWDPQKGEALALGFQHESICAPEKILYFGDGTIREQGRKGDLIVAIIYLLVEGIGLDDYLSRGTISLGQVARFGIEICGALQYVHSRDMIHGDLNLKNILITPKERPVLLDFGVARRVGTSPMPKSPKGAVMYASPQRDQWGDAPYSPADDVYSLGMLLCRAYYGRFPSLRTQELPSPISNGLREKHFRDLISELFQHAPDRRPTLERVIQVLMALADS